MANLEQLGQFLRMLSHYLKKMELELTCPSCAVVLRKPKVLPCAHIVCSQCIMAKDEYECECPVCVTTCRSGDIRPILLMEKMIDIFRSFDDAISSSIHVPKTVPQSPTDHSNAGGDRQGSQLDKSVLVGIKSPSVDCPFSLQNTKERLGNSKYETSGIMPKLSVVASPLSCNNYTKEKMREGLASGFVNSRMCEDGGGSGELSTSDTKTYTHNATEAADINPEQPSALTSSHGLQEPKTNDVQRSSHGSEGESVENLPIEMETARRAETQKTWLFQHSGKSNDSKCHTLVSSSDTDDDVREVKRQKLENEQPCCTYDQACAKETARCAFCHMSEITEFSGPMLHYVNERPMKPEEVNLPNVIVKSFHEKCFEWAPQAFFDGEIAKNMESELGRALKIKCCECGLKGAALGCYVNSCWRSYHVPCAKKQTGCRWDYENFNLLCPSHSSCKFRHEVDLLQWATKAKRTSVPHDKSKTRHARSEKCSSAQRVPGHQTSTPDEHRDELWEAEHGFCSQWVLCGSDLSTSEMALLNKFASLSGASVTGKWTPSVSHLIASTDEHGACNRTLKVLKAILNGKWVLTIDWVKACMAARSPISEEAYEIGLDCYGITDGPKKGRIRALQKAPKILAGLTFYFTDQFEPYYKDFLEEVVLVAGGTILKNIDLVMEASKAKVFPIGPSFIVYNEDPPSSCNDVDRLKEIVSKRCDEIEAVEAKTGFRVIGHMQLLDHIAACNSAAELESSLKTGNDTR